MQIISKMNYNETLEWMFNQLPMFQHIGAKAYKKDLSNTLLLLEKLNNPHKKITTIHVAGTNGKGSTSSMIASVLQEANLKVGLYTSPHLKDFRERIKINGNIVSEDFVVNFINENKDFLETNKLSFFEMTVAMAFEYFSIEKVDVAVIEVGLGGRLDSTNVITPLLSVITNIGLDHVQILGNTLAEIAREKAGIIKPNIPVVIGEYTQETKEVFNQVAQENNSEIFYASDEINFFFPVELKGIYQQKNKKTALKSIEILKDTFNISQKNILDGMKNITKNTGLSGRWQIKQENPKVILDTAHNAHGIEQVVLQLKKESYHRLHIVIGVVNDKDIENMLALLPQNAIFYFCKPNIPRGLDAKLLQDKAFKFSLLGSVYDSVSIAYNAALGTAQENDVIFVGGSTFVVAEIV